MAQYSSYIAGSDYYSADMNQRESDWVKPGILTLLDLVVAVKSGLSVSVSGAPIGNGGGDAWLPKGYRFNNDSEQVVALDVADVTNARIDLIVAGVDTTQTPYLPIIKAIKGTPSASPVVPTVPGTLFSIVLAQVLVSANQTVLVAGNLTDRRGPASLSGPIVLQNVTVDPVSPAVGQMWIRTDLTV